MTTPKHLTEQGLPTGHVSIGDCALSLRPMLLTTVLGSCVSVTFHHPDRAAGGMFHAMLPDRSMRRHASPHVCTYADLAVEAMLERFAELGMPADELVVKIFGGANTMLTQATDAMREMLDVGRKNVDSALATLAVHGLAPRARDVLGGRGRKLFFATATGEVYMSYIKAELAQAIQAREAQETGV